MIKYPTLFIVVLLFLGCKKTTNITNNIPISSYPGFTVQGMTDIEMSSPSYASVGFSVVYHDSLQEYVSLQLSSFPEGITINDNWQKGGYPTFNTQIKFFDTNLLNPAAPGTYPLTITATGAKSGPKIYTFNLIVKDWPSCSDPYIGEYPNCTLAATGTHYADTIIKDPKVTNKIWFKNFANTGKAVAGILQQNSSGTYTSLTVPVQKIDTVYFSGNGTAYPITNPIKMKCNARINGSNITFNM